MKLNLNPNAEPIVEENPWTDSMARLPEKEGTYFICINQIISPNKTCSTISKARYDPDECLWYVQDGSDEWACQAYIQVVNKDKINYVSHWAPYENDGMDLFYYLKWMP